MIETIHERIELLVKEFGDGKNTVFADKIGVSEGNIRGYIKGIMPKYDVLEKIATSLDVNPDWLLTGRGDMLKAPASMPVASTAKQVAQGGIPLIPVDAIAGVLSGNSIAVMDYECDRYDIPMFRGAEFLIRINGDSMQPKYYSGDIIACKRLRLDTFFQWNKVYVVDSEQGVIVKRVRPGHDDKHVIMVSENEAYAPFELPLEKVYSIALVIGVVRAE